MARLAEIVGKALSGEWGTDHVDGMGIPVLRTTNFTNEGFIDYEGVVTRTINKKNIEEKYLRHGDIIIEKSGGSDNQPVGRVVFFDGPEHKYLFNNFTGLLRVKNQEKWEPKYIFYSLFSNYKKGGTRIFENRTTGLHNLKTDEYISKHEVKDITIAEQKLICRQLDAIDRIVKMQKNQILNLDVLIQSRFVEMFGDPVGNPHGYEKVPLSELADIKIGPFGSLLHKEDYIEGGHPLLNPSHIAEGKVTPDTKLTISDEKFNELSAYHLKVGDVVMGRRGEMGRCAVVLEEGFLCGTGSLLIRSKGEVTADYIQKVISFPSFKKTIEDMAVGQTMPNLNVPIVSNFQIIKPPRYVQDSYNSFVHQTDELKFTIQKSLAETQTLMDSLMQEYFG
ncbi:MAG: restriction endonuclease subunit S [Eubacterium sp.]|nr:restriction endonuclease subunit S [Eubacterium sp.]